MLFETVFSIANMFRYKDPVPQNLRSGVVYKLQCEACDALYVGKTYQCLIQRLERELGGKENSAAYGHTQKYEGHSFNINKAEILCFEKNNDKLEMNESLFIGKIKPVLNKNISSRPLLLF